MTPEIAEALAKFRERVLAKLLATTLSPSKRSEVERVLNKVIQDFDKPPKTPQPDSEVLWKDNDNQQ